LLAELNAQLLDGFLSGDEDVAKQFKARVTPYVVTLARRFGPDLAASLTDEIKSETWLILVERGRDAFDAERGNGNLKSYLFYVVKRAVQRVRADNAKPGQRTRYRKGQLQEGNVSSIDCLPQVLVDERAADVVRQIEARHDVAALLAEAPKAVAVALLAIHIRDRKLSDVSRQLDMSRFRLTRAITDFAESVRNRRTA
jgi:DNA-directed RNA polymerase specialized sigma24 family protein